MKGILTLTALSFVSLFGLSRTIERIPEEGKAIASVGGKKITVARYINELTKQIRMIGKTTGKPFSMKDAIEDNLLESQLDSMITRATMERTTELLKLTVSDGDVRDEIKKKKGFQGLDGSFNMAFYKQYLSHLGISEKEFVDDIFLEMRMKQLNQAASLLSDVSQEMAEWHYRLQNEKRSVDMFTIKPSGLKIAGRPTAQEKEALYKEMADGLMSPEYRSFTVMTLTMDDVAGKITLSEE